LQLLLSVHGVCALWCYLSSANSYNVAQ